MPEEIRKQVDDFFGSYKEVSYPKGQLLLLPGDLTGNVYYLEDGRVSVYDISYRGDEIILFTFMPNSYFPMASVINNVANRFFYKTDTPARVRIAPAADFNTFIRNNSAMSYHLLSRAYNRFEYTLERTLHLVSGSARSRLIFELIVEFKSYGKGDSNTGYIETSESSVASRAGLSRETVSREMKHLKEAGLVALTAHKIHLNDVATLTKLIDSHP